MSRFDSLMSKIDMILCNNIRQKAEYLLKGGKLIELSAYMIGVRDAYHDCGMGKTVIDDIVSMLL